MVVAGAVVGIVVGVVAVEEVPRVHARRAAANKTPDARRQTPARQRRLTRDVAATLISLV